MAYSYNNSYTKFQNLKSKTVEANANERLKINNKNYVTV